jgi:hypothetical protein
MRARFRLPLIASARGITLSGASAVDAKTATSSHPYDPSDERWLKDQVDVSRGLHG